MQSFQKNLVFIWLMLVTISCMVALFLVWNDNIFKYIEIQKQVQFKVFAYTFLAGVLGATIYTWRGFYKSIAETEDPKRMFDFKWIYWYMIRPLTGGIFGFVVFAFVRAELIAFGHTSDISQANNLMFFAVSFLAGFGFHDFAEYLNNKTKGLFTK